MSGPTWSARTAPALGAAVDLLVGAELVGPPACPGRVEVIRCPGEGTLWLFPMGPDRQRIYLNLPLAQPPKGSAALEAALRARLDRLATLMGPMRLRPGSARRPRGYRLAGAGGAGKALLAGDAAVVCTPCRARACPAPCCMSRP